jgi:acyl-CoA synthetase (AMP-forming)/AMP-acid ligase II
MPTDWNFADVWELVARTFGSAPALVHGTRRISWAEMDRHADALANWLLEMGVQRQDKFAQYLFNCPEYLESMFAGLKIGLVPVNTNYRYADDELAYLWDNADAVAVVFHGSFSERIEKLRDRVPRVRGWLWVDDGTGECPPWATSYGSLVYDAEPDGHHHDSASHQCVSAPWGRGGDDLLMLYTGGTTGMPKGVMWRQDDLFARLNEGNMIKVPENGGLEGVRHTLVGSGPVLLPACPLMHGTGMFTSMGALATAGCVVTLVNRHFVAEELLDTIDEENVNAVVIVGDAFAKPILAALDREPGRWRLSTLIAMVSSGVMWSEETKRGLLHHHPSMVLVDAFSSSEALGMGTSVSTGSSTEHTAHFRLSPHVRVIDPETHKDVVPGSGEVGMLALGGRNPLGYYKDSVKSDATFREIDGIRYSIPGDYATVEDDGSIQLLGRGSVVINTGGEKVFPEEVEETLKRHPAVFDAIAVGVPDERFGEALVAVVELREGTSATEDELVEHAKSHLARFKAPKRVRFVPTIGRSPSGKLDYSRHRAEAIEWVSDTPGRASQVEGG